ncbi:helix-turn-helix domain-containing protein [Streptomyces sp. NPDC050400]|uniref:helix-turn-helix domain-containing protein n=1 Tax=Streptomyces sp. NPDC050400 TaxID=3365610 RepID=UPI00378D97EC
MSTCAHCNAPLDSHDGEARTGRPRLYCSTSCRQAAHRARTNGTPAVPAPAAPEAPLPTLAASAEEVLRELVRDLQEEIRQLLRTLDLPAPADEPLRRVVQMRTQLDCLTAGLVGRARHRRTPWRQIGKVLTISEDSARHRYTDDYIVRRLSQVARLRDIAAGLNELHGQSDTTDTHDPDGDDSEPGPPQRPASPAFNRLAPVLSMLARTSKLSLQDISERVGCSASYLSRIVNGERVPSWRITERFAAACSADPAVLRKVWESERLQDKEARPADRELHPVAVQPGPPADGQALVRFGRALHTLHVRAGQPTAYDVAVALKWKLTANEITRILDGGTLPDRDQLKRLLAVLGGTHDYFEPLWQAAADELHALAAADHPDTATHADQSHTPSDEEPPPSAATEGVSRLLTQFSDVLRTGPRLNTQQAARMRRGLAQRRNLMTEQTHAPGCAGC